MTRYLELAQYLWLAEQVTGVEARDLARASRVDLADSALHAPAAGFGDDDFYPDRFDKVAVLCCRLSWNHPLPDGNKRAAWAALTLQRMVEKEWRRPASYGSTGIRWIAYVSELCAAMPNGRGLFRTEFSPASVDMCRASSAGTSSTGVSSSAAMDQWFGVHR